MRIDTPTSSMLVGTLETDDIVNVINVVRELRKLLARIGDRGQARVRLEGAIYQLRHLVPQEHHALLDEEALRFVVG
jgi:hypothetical protein